MAGAVVAGSSGRRPGTMRTMPTSRPSRRLGPPWLEGRRRLFIGLTGLLLVLVAGTIGYVGFGLSLLDAVFQTVITVSTVGFGEARPFGSGAKVFTIVLILVGVATAAYTFGVAIDTLVEDTWTAPSGGAGWNGGSRPCAAT
jgi:Ion channel